jgi:hypothetical protein
MMKNILLFLMLVGIASPCFAKARYAQKKDMIREAECIAIVNVTKVEKADKKEKSWTYRQKATATVEQCLKGDVKGDIVIYGLETFKCAQCRYEKGRFILFLRKDGTLWVGSNWHLGIRPINKDKVQWFKGDETRFEMKPTPLDDVIEEITIAVVKGYADRIQKGMSKEDAKKITGVSGSPKENNPPHEQVFHYDYEHSYLQIVYSVDFDNNTFAVLEKRHIIDNMTIAQRNEKRREAFARWVQQRSDIMKRKQEADKTSPNKPDAGDGI